MDTPVCHLHKGVVWHTLCTHKRMPMYTHVQTPTHIRHLALQGASSGGGSWQTITPQAGARKVLHNKLDVSTSPATGGSVKGARQGARLWLPALWPCVRLPVRVLGYVSAFLCTVGRLHVLKSRVCVSL